MTDSAVHFDAVLHPHRSLTPRSFLIVMILIGTLSFIGGVVFLLMGAWPVFGFFGLDAALVYIAFKRNFRDGERYETVRLTDDTLEIHRVEPDGSDTCQSFQPYWTKVLVDEEGCLVLRSHGRSVEIGRFLVDYEKESFRAALDTALRRLKPARI
ncbi:MAG: DUF2244 domain-containing protein [Alphaproteobacteria bacterium]|nr:DUF2244 domain-containing protein [Alphaproteobacteria bacterium]